MDIVLAFLGKMHLLLLHLPIGLLISAAGMGIWMHFAQKPHWKPLVDLSTGMGALTAVFTAACGWLLAQTGDYEAGLIDWHRWTGVATALSAVGAWLIRHHKWYTAALLWTALLTTAAGHFGGAITHGEDYLWAGPSARGPQDTDPNAAAFEAVIMPILQQKCVSCHQVAKKKGGLLLDSFEHLMQGGEHGKVVVSGHADSSALYQRILLPAHDEKHMPPKGKLQLSAEETDLIRRWIDSGDLAGVRAGAIMPEQKVSPFPDVAVPPVSAADIRQIKAQLIPVTQLEAGKPWLSVSFNGRKDLSPAAVAALAPALEQIVHLDASYSNWSDALMDNIAKMPHLTRLHLAHTPLGNEGIRRLKNLSYLRYLNLNGVQVNDEILPILAALPALEQLYVWNTSISAEALEAWKRQKPGVRVGHGIPLDTSAADLQLLPPKMVYSRSIFDDTLQVRLDFPFKGVELWYTLDESAPGPQAQRYEGRPIVLNQSATVKAIAVKSGWVNSTEASAGFAKRKYKPQAVVLSKPPSPKYPGKGGASLSDQVLGSDSSDPAFLGYEGEHLVAVLDFGAEVPVARAGVHYLEHNAAWIFAPKGLEIASSPDGIHWRAERRADFPVNSSMQPTRTGVCSVVLPAPVRTRYLQIKVVNLLKNPVWHPGAGKPCWVFVDEVLVE